MNEEIKERIRQLIDNGNQLINKCSTIKNKKEDNFGFKKITQNGISSFGGSLAKDIFGIPKKYGKSFTKGFLKSSDKKNIENQLSQLGYEYDYWRSSVFSLVQNISVLDNKLTLKGNTNRILKRFKKITNSKYRNLDTRIRHNIAILEDLYHESFILNSEIPSYLQTIKQQKIAKLKKVKEIGNTIIDNIVYKRDTINTIFQSHYKFKLFKENEKAMMEIRKTCNSEEEFTHRILNLAILIDEVETEKLKEILKDVPNISEAKSITLIENLLNRINPSYDKSLIKDLRTIMDLRNKRMHDNMVAFMNLTKEFGMNFPINDWNDFWISILKKYSECLEKLENELKVK